MKCLTFWVTCFTLILLNGCGFHLRGIHTLPLWLNPITIILEKADPTWIPLLREQFNVAHVTVMENPTQARYWLSIKHEQVDQNIISISSGSSPRQYQLTYHVTFSLQQAHGKEILAPTTILVTRPLTINNDRILGSHDEEAQLINEMRRDAAMQMLYRLTPLSHTKTP